MERIPCIKCTPALWEYIKPYLEEWRYIFGSIGIFEKYQLLVINYNGDKMCTNVHISEQFDYNRELITDVEEFLERAAKLKGCTYKRKNIMAKYVINGVEIKPGMVIEIQDNDKELSYVVFPLLNGRLGLICYNKSSWSGIEYFIKYYSHKIICIHDLTSEELGELSRGKVLWEKPKEIILTIDEIAGKFGCPAEQIRIKK